MKNNLNINFEFVARNLSINALKKFISILENELKRKELKRYESKQRTN